MSDAILTPAFSPMRPLRARESGLALPEAPAPELSEKRVPAVRKIRNWLVDEGRASRPLAAIIAGLVERLHAVGLPIDRMTFALESLHAEQFGIGVFWSRGMEAMERPFPYGPRAEDVYAASPFAYAHQTRSWVVLDLAETPDEAFGIIRELKDEGYAHYVCAPIPFLNGAQNGMTIATVSPEGFSEDDLAAIGGLLPTLAIVLELTMARRTLDDVLSTYVGDEPRQRILSGDVRRGQVTRIRSAILFADMRGFTALSMRLPEEALSDLLNAFYDCLVPAIEAEGGEVLKYMGDGILAIVRDKSDDFGGAANAALAAARKALEAVDMVNATGAAPAEIDLGIALHHGRAAYGNIGSGTRLDFTVIGRDVNLASRIGRLCAQLGRRLLVTRSFAEQIWEPLEEVGSFELAGIPEAQRVYALPGM